MTTQSTVRIQKMTTKGQVTLPSKWRRLVGTDHISVESEGKSITITPVYPDGIQEIEYTVFDAIRDNKGKGLRAKDLLAVLRKIDRNG